MAIFVTAAKSAIAYALKGAEIYAAFGSGSLSWDTSLPAEQMSATGLTAEFGCRKVSLCEFCVEDSNGDIYSGGLRYSLSHQPTGLLYVQARLFREESEASAFRECALFLGREVDPVNQDATFMVPGEVVIPGQMLALVNHSSIQRSTDFAVGIEFVLIL